MKETFEERKQKILDKIFIGTEEHNKFLEKKIKLLEKQIEILRKASVSKARDLWKVIKILVEEHEIKFRDEKKDIVSEDVKNYSLSVRVYIEKNLEQTLFPDFKRAVKTQERNVTKMKREYKELLTVETKRLIELKK